jgi:hypothetical protein
MNVRFSLLATVSEFCLSRFELRSVRYVVAELGWDCKFCVAISYGTLLISFGITLLMLA